MRHGIKLPNNSPDGSSDSSDFICFESARIPKVEESKEIVIRPDDFLVNEDDLLRH